MCIHELETSHPILSCSIQIIKLDETCHYQFVTGYLFFEIQFKDASMVLALMLNLVDSNHKEAESCIKLIKIQFLKNSIVMFTIRILIEIFRIFHLYSDRKFQNLNLHGKRLALKLNELISKIRNFIDYRL